MNWPKAIILGVTIGAGSMLAAPRVLAQTTFQGYRCGDGTQFIVAFYPGDSRAHMQIDGREVTLARRFAVAGTRYAGGGVSLQITRAGATTVRHVKRPLTACEQI
jgi:membrane-bound inhibitor of C-type lysozyme